MARIHPTQQTSNRANLVGRLYKLSQNKRVQDAGKETTHGLTNLTRSVRELVDAVRDAWPLD